MGILDYISNPNFSNQLMMLGETMKAADQSRPANLAPFMARKEQLQGQERMNKFAQQLAEGGILQKLYEKRGYGPEATSALAAMLEAGGPGLMPYVLKTVFPGAEKDPGLIREIETATGFAPGSPEFFKEYLRSLSSCEGIL